MGSAGAVVGTVVGAVPEPLPPVAGVVPTGVGGTGVGVETAVGVGRAAVGVGCGELPGFTVGVAGGWVAPGPPLAAEGRAVAVANGTLVSPGRGVAVAAGEAAVLVAEGFAAVVAVGCPWVRVGGGVELRSGAVRWSIAASSWAASMIAGFSGANFSCGGAAE